MGGIAHRIRYRWAALVLLAAAGALLVAYLLTRPEREAEHPLAAFAACLDRPAADDPDAAGGECALSHHPETFTDLATLNAGVAARTANDAPRDAITNARLARGRRSVAGTHGRWRPVGKGPLHADDPDYPSTYGDGFGELAGRISDYSYDARHDRLYASVASGGVWLSTDKGRTWRSIGNKLPTQTVGSVAYTPAAGGTIVAVTGDGAFGGNTYGGVGVFYSRNNGRTWRRSAGVPSGAQGFKAAVDPTNPRVVYAATGAGLFRSTNAGGTFRNVNLPTGDRCQGTTLRRQGCFFANIVTDVVVQAPDKFGHAGGTVLAVVGWREGAHKGFDGIPEAPGNGLYRSDSGRVGTFKGLDEDANGFAPQARIGRVEMGAATGPDQDHGYVYAVVQDAVLFDKGTVEGLDVPDANVFGLASTATPTYLNGIYVSSDFGKTWTQMADDNQMLLPTSGSVLAQLTPLGFGPGIQAWYDEWIRPDPTKQIGGVPTRLVFGLEELFENQAPVPQDGHSTFKAIGPYNANGGACLLVLASDACSDVQGADPGNTTTHPDQHAGFFIPDGQGGVTLLAGNDGGNYTQHVGSGGDFTKNGFGLGAQDGFHTLLPYGAAEARDGVVYAGLQDNGEIRVEPKTGHQTEVYGGDGVFTAVDPANSDVAYEEYPGASISLTTDGGKTWSDISPFVNNPSFYSPLVMDPKNAKHVVSAGRQIVETTVGPDTTSPSFPEADTDWHYVYDLRGRGQNHGVPNQVSALAVRGRAIYAGYCGGCDVVRDHTRFANGLATNVGGHEPPKPNTSHGWHKVPARGLPSRFISSVTIDPRHHRTVYVTLGASDIRPYSPPHALGPDGLQKRGGHVYKSTDGGRTFHDISGNLEEVPALWSVIHHGQLMVATTVGVFASHGKDGGHYAPLGHNLPRAPVFQIANVPGHRHQLLAASLGRGVYRYHFQ